MNFKEYFLESEQDWLDFHKSRGRNPNPHILQPRGNDAPMANIHSDPAWTDVIVSINDVNTLKVLYDNLAESLNESPEAVGKNISLFINKMIYPLKYGQLVSLPIEIRRVFYIG